MTTPTKPWRAKQFGKGYSAEFLPVGEHSWRIVKSGGEAIVFGSFTEAIGAAENAYLQRLEPNIRATLPVDPSRLEARLQAEAESWLRTSREDRRKADTIYRPGKRPLLAMPGRAT